MILAIILYHVARPEAPLGGRGGRFVGNATGPQEGNGGDTDGEYE